MLVSVVLDTFVQAQAREVYDALRDLFRPDVNSGWAAVGLYAYWHPETHELLYVGLARNLATRFAQHNGLRACPPKACKREQIREHFASCDALGFTVVAQSAHLQGIVDPFDDDVIDVMKNGEGHLIASYAAATGALPRWNGIGGSKSGQEMNVETPSGYYEVVTNRRDSLLAARRSLRELSADPTAEWFEHNIHAARMWATEETLLGGDGNVLHWLYRLRDDSRYGADKATIERILESGYLRNRALPIAV